MEKYKSFETILTNLNILKYVIISKVKTGNYSANKQVEGFYRDVLNLVYNWELKRSDKITNVGIDLSCETNEVGVQITSQRGKEKILKTLQLFDKYYYDDLKRVIIFNITSKSNHSKEFTSQVPFDKSKDIIDVDDLLCDIEKLNTLKVKEIESYIVREIPYYIGRFTSEGDILRDRIDFLNVKYKNCDRLLELYDDIEHEKLKLKITKLHENLLEISKRQRLGIYVFFLKCDKSDLELPASTWSDVLINSFDYKEYEIHGLYTLLEKKGFLYSDEDQSLEKLRIMNKELWQDILTIVTTNDELSDFICNVNFSMLDN
jgi:hypothetical protein